MVNSGITDKDAMIKIVDSGMEVEDAMKYYTVAQHCPQEIFYDDALMNQFCGEIQELDDTFANRSFDEITNDIKMFM